MRVVSVWLPFWPTERLRRPAGARPCATVISEAGRRVLDAVDPAARRLGLRPGMTLAAAQAVLTTLVPIPADPAGEAEGLARLARWALRYAPLVAPAADGFWIDITGAAHLAGGEAALLADLAARLARFGLTARAAVADTPGAAWAVARYGEVGMVPPGGAAAALAPLPVAALRLDPPALALLERLGVTRIADLAALPRAPLARRLGAVALRRLDQALGHLAEPLSPLAPPVALAATRTFPEPLTEAAPLVPLLADAIAALSATLCARLEAAGLGARRLALRAERLDGTEARLTAGTAAATRAAPHLARLLVARLERLDPGQGIAALHLAVIRAEPLAPEQTGLAASSPPSLAPPSLAPLLDRLAGRLGEGRIWRAAPTSSAVPERAVRRIPPMIPPMIPPLAPPAGAWPAGLPRPPRLLTPPQPIEALALLPDRPPAAFVWRRRRFLVRRADGPERVRGEWWRRAAETEAVRDYWRVEDAEGQRFWLYRRGDGMAAESGDLCWFLHGIG